MDVQNFEVQGLAELELALLDLGAETGFKTLRAAGREAMKPVMEDMKANAKHDTGDLEESIVISSTAMKRSQRGVLIHVGPTRKRLTRRVNGEKQTRTFNRTFMKALAQEYGTHGKRKQKAEPFIRPALDKNVRKVLDIFKANLAKRIDRAAKRAARKAGIN